jgi:hypothetical protein
LKPLRKKLTTRATILFYIRWRPSILRKTGLQQGFELFEDSIHPKSDALHRPFEISTGIFQRRLTETKKHKFFSVIYIPDLLYSDFPTQNILGEVRSTGAESQIEEFKENLEGLFFFLKKEGLWDQTHVVLVWLEWANSK